MKRVFSFFLLDDRSVVFSLPFNLSSTAEWPRLFAQLDRRRVRSPDRGLRGLPPPPSGSRDDSFPNSWVFVRRAGRGGLGKCIVESVVLQRPRWMAGVMNRGWNGCTSMIFTCHHPPPPSGGRINLVVERFNRSAAFFNLDISIHLWYIFDVDIKYRNRYERKIMHMAINGLSCLLILNLSLHYKFDCAKLWE